jgi:peptide deformylase
MLPSAVAAGQRQSCSIRQKDALWEAMTIKPLIILPDPILRQVSQPVEQVDSEITRLADDMLETMYDAPGIGLAAIQIGVPRRLLVIDVSKEDEDNSPLVFINPADRRVVRRAFGLRGGLSFDS